MGARSPRKAFKAPEGVNFGEAERGETTSGVSPKGCEDAGDAICRFLEKLLRLRSVARTGFLLATQKLSTWKKYMR